MAIHFLGIRHHGPGSSRNVLQYLRELNPDLILLEGPAEAEPLLPGVSHPDMLPPVALLAYNPDDPQQAVFYPFAEFSPEWQALKYASERQVPVRFFDLPLTYSMGLDTMAKEVAEAENKPEDKSEDIPEEEASSADGHTDPFTHLARISGADDGEQWWDRMVECRRDAADIFPAVQEAVTALRECLPSVPKQRELLREAWMRKMIRAAQKENFERIAVVCGAWHVPALAKMPLLKEDNELLKGLPKIKVECTWIPWTYDRLSFRSGYGAGIESPGWYHHQWHFPDDDGTWWVSLIASLLRKKNMDVSVAHVIETVRLANATAALRGVSRPALSDFNDAVTAVMGFGDDILLQIVREELVISDRMGNVPDNVPKVPLVLDVERQMKKLRISAAVEIKTVTLDLRKPTDLAKSIFFHRLSLLGIGMASPEDSSGKGTFRETWIVYYKPEHILSIIERAIWGNTLADAVVKYVKHTSSEIGSISQLTGLLEKVIPADCPDLVEAMTTELDTLSAATSDIIEMMRAVPGLVTIVRYGSVRAIDYSRVDRMLNAMLARIMAGGVLLCMNIDEEAADEILNHLISVDYAVSTANQEDLTEMWNECLLKINGSQSTHPLLSGYTTRLLNDKGLFTYEDMERILSYYSSPGNTPSDIAFWFESFLKSSGTILLLHDTLWRLVNGWVTSLEDETFMGLLPILKRTFSEFTPAERRKLGEKAKNEDGTPAVALLADSDFNEEEAGKVIPLLHRLLGLQE